MKQGTTMHATSDLDHADTLPVVPPGAGRGLPLTRFDALTRSGAISLQVEGAPATHAAEAALVLDRCDALLDALDAWLHTALDWRWVRTSDAAPSAVPCATARCTIDGDVPSADPLTCR